MFGAILGLGKFTGIVGKILEFAPIVIDIVERIVGPSDGERKRITASREIVEFVRELVENGDEFGGFDEDVNIDKDSILAALEDEEEFVAKIIALNDAIVDLTNYINSHQNEG